MPRSSFPYFLSSLPTVRFPCFDFNDMVTIMAVVLSMVNHHVLYLMEKGGLLTKHIHKN